MGSQLRTEIFLQNRIFLVGGVGGPAEKDLGENQEVGGGGEDGVGAYIVYTRG